MRTELSENFSYKLVGLTEDGVYTDIGIHSLKYVGRKGRLFESRLRMHRYIMSV